MTSVDGLKSIPKRILLKLSGEVLAGGSAGGGIDEEILKSFSRVIIELSTSGIEIAVVIGGGNYFRGSRLINFDRVRADFMGMLATILNALAFENAIERNGGSVSVLSAIPVAGAAEEFNPRHACKLLEAGEIVICAGGTGNPYVTTDTAAALRAVQLDCHALLKGTKVDGVYDSDPEKNPDAKRYDSLSFTRVLQQDLGVMDGAAVAICRDNRLPIIIFDVTDPENILRVVRNPGIGTVVKGD